MGKFSKLYIVEKGKSVINVIISSKNFSTKNRDYTPLLNEESLNEKEIVVWRISQRDRIISTGRSELFKNLDTEKKDYLTSSDIEEHLQTYKDPNNKVTASQIISKLDTNENGKVELDEFKNIFDNDRIVKYERVFQAFDDDNSGTLDQQELKKLMATIEELSDEELLKMFEEADLNNDGQLSFSEFYEICNR